jgi:hypothetical protein
MKGQVLIINFKDDKAYLTESKALTLRQLGLPDLAQRFKSPAVWTIKVLHHFPEERRIFAEILSYKNGKLPFPNDQISRLKDIYNIDKITFRSIYTNGLLLTLAGNATARTIMPTDEKTAIKEQRTKIYSQPSVQINRVTQYKTIRETYSIPLKNVRFKHGYVAFDKHVSQLNRTIEFTVANDDIQEEFDAVKNYFGNVLHVKKFQFYVEIQLKDKEITAIETKSPDVSRIDQKIIESVRFEVVKSYTKTKSDIETNKSIYTMDEFFDTLTDRKVKANVFYDNENQLLEDLLQITDTKHYKHLRFLSNKHAHSIMKLRFVIKPFSFIFLIEGERNYHIIWETLDTEEATYVWHEDKDINKLRLTLKKIEDIIQAIKIQGKTAYLNKTEGNFRRMYHDYSEFVNGFIKWKGELESVLT